MAFGLTLVAAAAFALVGLPSAGAKGKANTKVTIQGGGGLVEGEVKSPDENDCADQRKVLIFQVKNGDADKGRFRQGDAERRPLPVGQRRSRAASYFAKVVSTNQCQGDATRGWSGRDTCRG